MLSLTLLSLLWFLTTSYKENLKKQGQLQQFLINSTIGIGGLFDVANELEFVQEATDFAKHGVFPLALTLYFLSWDRLACEI